MPDTALTSKILEKSAERPKCLEAWLSLAEPSFLQDSLAISHVPCAMVFVHTAVLITETCFHDDSICGFKPQSVRPSAINMILGQWTFFKLTEA